MKSRNTQAIRDHSMAEVPDTLVVSYTTIPSGERVLTKSLVEQMRRYRGRLTRTLLCSAMGWDRSAANIKMVSGICERWEIVTADYLNPGRAPEVLHRGLREKQARHATEDAKRLLSKQIELAVVEAQTEPLYKKGDLSW